PTLRQRSYASSHAYRSVLASCAPSNAHLTCLQLLAHYKSDTQCSLSPTGPRTRAAVAQRRVGLCLDVSCSPMVVPPPSAVAQLAPDEVPYGENPPGDGQEQWEIDCDE